MFKIRKFYVVFSNKKVAPMVPQLTWSQCLLLLPIKDVDKINYYIHQVAVNSYTKRQLEAAIKSKEYERLDKNKKLKLMDKNELDIISFVKNPILIKNSDNYKVIFEKILQKLVLEDIENFMRELGNLFCFIESEYRIRIGNAYNYIDLLLYNIQFRCYVVIELKIEFPNINGFSVRNLKYMKKFYLEYKDDKLVQRIVAQLPWRHNIVLMKL